MHNLGFEVSSSSKGLYFDGHERRDVIQNRHKFMAEIGFVHPDQAPMSEAANAFQCCASVHRPEKENSNLLS